MLFIISHCRDSPTPAPGSPIFVLFVLFSKLVGSTESIQTISESPTFRGSFSMVIMTSFPASYLHVKTVSQVTIIMKTFLAQPAGIATVDLWCKEKNYALRGTKN